MQPSIQATESKSIRSDAVAVGCRGDGVQGLPDLTSELACEHADASLAEAFADHLPILGHEYAADGQPESAAGPDRALDADRSPHRLDQKVYLPPWSISCVRAIRDRKLASRWHSS
jgi:hypothetical protein